MFLRRSTAASGMYKYVPMETKRVRTRSSVRWYDSECRAMRQKMRQLDRKYRGLRTAEALSLWRKQFNDQRRMFLVRYCQCCKNPRDVWKCIDSSLQPPQNGTSSKLSADDLADFFRNKVQNIRTSAAEAIQPLFADGPAPPLSTYEPATDDEIPTLIRTVPPKSS